MAGRKRRRRRLPRNITERPDSEVIELIFGKRVKREMDRIAGDSQVAENKGRLVSSA